ncbi:MAG: M1 family aminopeptidase, partial [Saprospiraceae bacterium]|nr:M1 family aminopeptidase [Saprospiraceae bacterium]
SFIQGGDGGMDYPMATLITGERGLNSLVGVSVHELMHSWYQMILGTNESLYAWMDEGFTSYASREVTNWLRRDGSLPGEPSEFPHLGAYASYAGFNATGREEAMITHSDHFVTNSAYSIAAYVKGSVFLHQLEYVVGEEAFDAGMLRYFREWKFKHPNPNDFIRIMEKESGLELDWYKEYWIHTVHVVDYSIGEVTEAEGGGTEINLLRLGVMPMPVDLQITFEDGSRVMYTIPLRIMRGHKTAEGDAAFKVAEDWPWTHPEYNLVIPESPESIQSIEIDPSRRLADVNPDNNVYRSGE